MCFNCRANKFGAFFYRKFIVFALDLRQGVVIREAVLLCFTEISDSTTLIKIPRRRCFRFDARVDRVHFKIFKVHCKINNGSGGGELLSRRPQRHAAATAAAKGNYNFPLLLK